MILCGYSFVHDSATDMLKIDWLLEFAILAVWHAQNRTSRLADLFTLSHLHAGRTGVGEGDAQSDQGLAVRSRICRAIGSRLG